MISAKHSPHPFMNDLKIRSASTEDFAEISAISDQVLGKDYLNEPLMNELLSQNKHFRIAEFPNNEIIGFSCFHNSTLNEIASKFGTNNSHYNHSTSSKIGIIKTIAVKSSHQGMGVGSTLLDDTMFLFNRQNIESVISVVWKSKKGVNMEGLMKRHEFKLIKELQNYWTHDSKEKGYLCPECGTPCLCSALIYLKAISQ